LIVLGTALGDLALEPANSLLTTLLLNRCFPHVVNLAVQAVLADLTKELSSETVTAYEGDDIDVLTKLLDTSTFHQYEGVPSSAKDVVLLLRGLVVALRASTQRREELADVIREGNSFGQWAEASKTWKAWWIDMDYEHRNESTDVTIPQVQVLRDCPTRWSSTYLMIHRALELLPVRHSLCF